jgi:hypothetical protein
MFFSIRLLIVLFRTLFDVVGDAQKTQIQRDRERDARLPDWRPRTRRQAEEADEDEESLDKAEDYEKSRQWKKALATYRELAKCSPVPDIVVKARMGIKRVKRAQAQGAAGQGL